MDRTLQCLTVSWDIANLSFISGRPRAKILSSSATLEAAALELSHNRDVLFEAHLGAQALSTQLHSTC